MNQDVSKFISDLDAGVFENYLGTVLCDVAAAAVDNRTKGKITIELELVPINNSTRLNVRHKVKYKQPTRNGCIEETMNTETPMHVGRGGVMTVLPQTVDFNGQGDMISATGGAVANTDSKTGAKS